MSAESINSSTFDLQHYDYALPEALIAQEPSQKRESSRLLVLNKKTGSLEDSLFSEIIKKLPKRALIIANNSRVVPARILGERKTGSKVEMLLMSPVALLEQSAKPKIICNTQIKQEKINCEQINQENESSTQINHEHSNKNQTKKYATAQVLLKGSKRIKIGEELSFHSLSIQILEKHDFGKHTVELTWENSLVAELEKYGSLPLPPYIKRPNGPSSYDASRYQTVYAKNNQAGSVAAPTAGLHFTKEIQEQLLEHGFLWEEVTLHVGYGTFSPVRAEDIREHDMHAEYVEIPERTAKAIIKAKSEGRPIITVGTTATRSVEGMAQAYQQLKQEGHCNNFTLNSLQNNEMNLQNEENLKNSDTNMCMEQDTLIRHKESAHQNSNTQELRSQEHGTQDTILPPSGCSGYTNIFIYPGKEFQVIDGLITNFHLPKSSLLMLVCAFAGYEKTMNAYAHAINEKYRFFSFGDAMLICA